MPKIKIKVPCINNNVKTAWGTPFVVHPGTFTKFKICSEACTHTRTCSEACSYAHTCAHARTSSKACAYTHAHTNYYGCL